MNILPPCLCNRPQKSTWLKIQCSNCLGVLKDSQNINLSSASSSNFQIPDTFSKSIIDYLNIGSKSVHKRSCTDKQPTFLTKSEKSKHISRNPSDPLLVHKANQLSAPCIFGREYLKRESVLYSHKNSVNCILIFGSLIWTAGQDYQAISCNMPGSHSYKYLQRSLNSCQTIHKRGVTSMQITSKDLILTSSLDKTVKLWGISDKLIKFQTYSQSGPVKSLTSLGSYFVSGTTDSKLNVWDMEKKKEVKSYEEHLKPVNYIESLRVNTLLSASADCTIKLWDLRSERSISSFQGHNEGVSSLKSIDQNLFLSSSSDQTVKVWDVRGTRMVDSWDTGQEISAIDTYKDLVFVAGESLQIWKKGTLLDETLARAKQVKVLPQSNKLLVGSFDNSVSIFKYFLYPSYYNVRHSERSPQMAAKSGPELLSQEPQTGLCQRVPVRRDIFPHVPRIRHAIIR